MNARSLVVAGILAAAVGLGAVPAPAASFRIDSLHSSAAFLVGHLGYSNMIGHFGKISGSFEFDPAAPEQSSARLVIDAASVDTNLDRRDGHLRSPDFFNVKEFPEITFSTTKVTVTGAKTGKVTGEVTMLGVTRSITLDVSFNKMAPNPRSKALTAGFSARGKIKRSDFGMKYALGGIGDEITLFVEIEGTSK
ncbi:MAG TPA: YceI family protein [Alphaproteobacteria bacterium]|jgi:polyisoprenoid-binding protein YceI|nr:YceI family protein [Alphaproteobacteria bacterium]MDP6268765.1 YceI family protein [Alphaproteobacteria bacterium]MDP7427467.1 YceI family protein [Alphaproteobacteria bacterium]HJM49875.1 YceI family protein [Alphaproteobacteria bacterium]|tara:strand:- start:11 stop:592 length:582 start_codon:yes stop_codon:yes gene_type:complete